MSKDTGLRQRALNILARRDISRAELARKLQAYAQDQAELTALLDDLAQRHWQSDSRFVESYVYSKKQQQGNRRIVQALKQQGVGDALIQRCLPGRDEQIQAAVAVLRKKYRAAPTDLKEKYQYLHFLAYRGFAGDIGQTALQYAWPSTGAGNHGDDDEGY